MKSMRSTLVFVAFVVAVICYAYFVEYKGGAKKLEQEEISKLVVGLDKDQIQKLKIKNSKGEGVFEKNNGQWSFSGPYDDIADNQQVETLIAQLLEEKYEEVVAEGEDLNTTIFGLNEKSSSITLQTATSQKEIQIGTETSVSNKKYIKIKNEKKVLLGGAAWEYAVEKDFKDLISKELLIKNDGIKKINITRPEGTLHFEEQEKIWKLLDLVTDDKNQDDISQVRNNVRALKATRFMSEDEKSGDVVGLNSPTYKIQIIYEDKTEAIIEFSAFTKAKEAYVKSSVRKGVFMINEYAAGFITKSLEDYRDRKRPFRLATKDFSHLKYASSLFSVELKNENGNWKSVEELKNKEVDQAQVQDLITRVSDLKIKKFFDKDVEFQKSGMNEFKLIDSKGQEALVLRWSSRPQGDIFIMTSNLEKYPFGIDIKDISGLPFQLVLLDKPEPSKPTSDPITEVPK